MTISNLVQIFPANHFSCFCRKDLSHLAGSIEEHQNKNIEQQRHTKKQQHTADKTQQQNK